MKYLERVFSYHVAALRDRSGLHVALAALLTRRNGGPDHCTVEYDPAEAAMQVTSDTDSLYLRARSGRYDVSLLRFVPVRSLTVACPGPFSLKELRGLNMEFLDISACGSVPEVRSFVLPKLKVLRVRSGQRPVGEWQQVITSDYPFEVVEVVSQKK